MRMLMIWNWSDREFLALSAGYMHVQGSVCVKSTFFKNIFVWTGLHLWNIFLVSGSFNHELPCKLSKTIFCISIFIVSKAEKCQEQRSIQHLFLLQINNRLCVWRVWGITWVCVIHSWCLLCFCLEYKCWNCLTLLKYPCGHFSSFIYIFKWFLKIILYTKDCTELSSNVNAFNKGDN